MNRLIFPFLYGLALLTLGWEFYSDRQSWQSNVFLYSSLPSFVFAAAVVLVASALLAHTSRNLFILGFLILAAELIQSAPFMPVVARVDGLDIVASLLGYLLSVLVFWRTKSRQHKRAWPIILLGSWVALVGCYGEDLSEPDVAEPVVKPRASIQQEVKLTAWRNDLKYQRLYAKDQFLYGIVIGEGVQIIDNMDPFKPTALHFVHIPGAHEVVIQGDTFIANNYSDLVFFSIQQQAEISRIPDLYSYQDYIELPPNTVWNDSYEVPEGYVAVDFKIVEDDKDREKENEESDPTCIVLLCNLF